MLVACEEDLSSVFSFLLGNVPGLTALVCLNSPRLAKYVGLVRLFRLDCGHYTGVALDDVSLIKKRRQRTGIARLCGRGRRLATAGALISVPKAMGGRRRASHIET